MKLKFFLRKINCPFDEIIRAIPENKKILDLGCGNAYILNFLLKKNFENYTGIDPKLKIKYNQKNNKIELKSIYAEDYLDKIQKYNCILMIDLMHHINKERQESFIKNVLKNMRSNSILIYKDMSNRNTFFGLMNKIHDLFYNLQIINYFSSKRIIELSSRLPGKYKIKHFYKRKFWYDHEFLIINKIR